MEKEIVENIKNIVRRVLYKPGEYHISELPFCIRRSYYFRKEKEEPELNGRMLAGILVHNLIPEVMMGIKGFRNAQFEVEKKLKYKGVIIVGHADILTDDCVYEVKFTGSKVESMSGLPLCYYSQANAYACMFNKEKYSLIIIDSYGPLNASIVSGNADKAAFKILLEKAVKLNDYIVDGQLPDIDFPSYKFECSQCQFAERCKNDLETEAYL